MQDRWSAYRSLGTSQYQSLQRATFLRTLRHTSPCYEYEKEVTNIRNPTKASARGRLSINLHWRDQLARATPGGIKINKYRKILSHQVKISRIRQKHSGPSRQFKLWESETPVQGTHYSKSLVSGATYGLHDLPLETILWNLTNTLHGQSASPSHPANLSSRTLGASARRRGSKETPPTRQTPSYYKTHRFHDHPIQSDRESDQSTEYNADLPFTPSPKLEHRLPNSPSSIHSVVLLIQN